MSSKPTCGRSYRVVGFRQSDSSRCPERAMYFVECLCLYNPTRWYDEKERERECVILSKKIVLYYTQAWEVSAVSLLPDVVGNVLEKTPQSSSRSSRNTRRRVTPIYCVSRTGGLVPRGVTSPRLSLETRYARNASSNSRSSRAASFSSMSLVHSESCRKRCGHTRNCPADWNTHSD